MMIEYASSYGNDWFVVPLTLPVGIAHARRLAGRDRHASACAACCGRSAIRALPRRTSRCGRWLHRAAPGGAPTAPCVEPVLPAADDRPQHRQRTRSRTCCSCATRWPTSPGRSSARIESPIEQPKPRVERDADAAADAPSDQPTRRRRATCFPRRVPSNWIPLLPVQTRGPDGKVVSRLGAAPCCSPTDRSGPSCAKRCARRSGELLLFDEEVPREGVHVTRAASSRAGSTARPGCGRRSQGGRARRGIERPRIRPAAIGVGCHDRPAPTDRCDIHATSSRRSCAWRLP